MKNPVTNVCEICEVRYKLPTVLQDVVRKQICFTCESHVMMLEMVKKILIEKKSKQSKVSDDKYINRVLSKSIIT